uniref:RNase H type-1 domain-containing protein n=1 Tax=Nicotiana tabacum TaxID=4097 RepID=A0A1S4CQK5_TOBAC|nr:PREDICTED: uncharacterized protein LOC107821417 [Nicotiana tabacum]
MAARKLRPYFQCHPISVVITYPLRNILHKQELPGRQAKWAIELSEYDIIHQPRTIIKSQVLADFVTDFNTKIIPEVEKELQIFTGANPGTWTLFTDGYSNVKGAGLGIVLIPPSGESIRQAIKCYPITNNEAEYEAVITVFELARELSIEQIMIKSDSQLVVNQMQGTYTAREARMQQYLEKARELARKFQSWKVVQILREENAEADALANLASVAEYGIVPEGKKESQVLRRKAARYCLIRDNLYQKMFGGPLARCLGPNQTEYVMREVHEGHCGNHAGGRSLVKTLIKAGYYWPKMEEDAENFVAKCDKCQRYAKNMHRPAELLHTVISPWPFMKWGIDIVGPLPQAKGKARSWQVKRITSSPYYPVANGQAESTNKIIINNLKKRLEKSKGNWPEELPGVLWAYRTTTKTTTGETPFSLLYGSEALIPVEIGEPSMRFTLATEDSNDKELRENLDLLE